MTYAFTILAIASTSSVVGATPGPDATLQLEPCYLEGISRQVLCGQLDVPENYEDPEGARLNLNVAVLPAIDPSLSSTPMLFLAGGPGQAATTLAALIRRQHFETLKTRDIVLIDQRGTGDSSPLECDTLEDEDVYRDLPANIDIKTEIEACLAQITQDLSQFNTENAIRDFDAVREALGYERVHLYGGSYGTRAALIYLQMFPSVVESAVLDSVGPVEVPIGLFGKSAADSFERLLENCRASTACSDAFPELKAEFDALVQRVSESPVEVEIPHPRTGAITTLRLDTQKLTANLRLQLYSREGRSLVPIVVHEAYHGNYRPLAGLISQTENGLGINSALTLNIVCNEDVPRVTADMLALDAQNTFDQDTGHRTFHDACPFWPRYTPARELFEPVTAEIPTLLLSGALDPVTPPSNAEITDQTLGNSRHLVAKHGSHIVAGLGCASELIAEFFEHLDPQRLDETCLDEIPPVTFMSSLNGTN
ncbi:MAG: alpha/beta hydrolase [Pseudomonadota bacterium]